jgi:hypothetical protein
MSDPHLCFALVVRNERLYPLTFGFCIGFEAVEFLPRLLSLALLKLVASRFDTLADVSVGRGTHLTLVLKKCSYTVAIGGAFDRFSFDYSLAELPLWITMRQMFGGGN